MAILLDSPRWPAHGTHFAHLVSDLSLAELFTFADANGLPVGAFDHDHYDVPAERCAELLAAGALPVESAELVRRLVASGMRVRRTERTPKVADVLPGLEQCWRNLLPVAPELGADLLQRWQEPQRRYHDVRHLAQMLEALEELTGGSTSRALALAAWFHDAVYQGQAGTDETASARLAANELAVAKLPSAEISEVTRLVLLTIDHRPDPTDTPGAQMVDADLSVLASPAARYHYYARSVRLEHLDLPLTRYAGARSEVLRGLLDRDPIFQTPSARAKWESSARSNITEELSRWSRFIPTAYYT